MKAWVVECEEDGLSRVIYTRKYGDALLLGADELGVPVALCSAYRYPEADLYAPYVSMETLVYDLDWWFHCEECGSEVAKELIDKNPLLVPSFWREHVFCSEWCMSQYKLNRPERLWLLERGKMIATSICPDAEIETTYTYRTSKHGRNEVAVTFRFPGGRGAWSDEEPEEVAVIQSDHENWHAYVECGKTVH